MNERRGTPERIPDPGTDRLEDAIRALSRRIVRVRIAILLGCLVLGLAAGWAAFLDIRRITFEQRYWSPNGTGTMIGICFVVALAAAAAIASVAGRLVIRALTPRWVRLVAKEFGVDPPALAEMAAIWQHDVVFSEAMWLTTDDEDRAEERRQRLGRRRSR